MTMIEIRPLNAPRFRASVLPEHYTEVSEALSKISTRKTRRPTIKADKRLYPAYWEGINTADYVRRFWELNFRAATPDDLTMFYQELSTIPQQWPAEPVFEALEPEDAPGPVHEALEPVLEALEPVLEALEPVLEALEPLAIPVLTTLTIEDTASLPAWLTRGVPPAWLK